MMIKILKASLRYKNHIIFDNLQFTIKKNKWTAILGPSGIGKSSLLKLLAGLLPKDAISEFIIETENSLHDKIAYLPQEDFLLPWLSTMDNLLISEKLHPSARNNQNKLIKQAETLLAEVKLTGAKNLYPHQLSGGMRQRLAIARLLLQDKEIILMDEPFKSLDAITRYHLQTLIATVLKNKTVLFITHDLQEALRLAHEIYFMKGQPPEFSLKEELANDPPRDLTALQVIETQMRLYPIWSAI